MYNNTALALTIDDSSQVGEARRIATALGREMGLSEVERGHLALVVTEAGSNLIQHAGGGRLLLQPVTQDDAGCRCIDVLAIDTGPGIRNVSSALRDGHSTAGTAGQGLGAIARISTAFDIFSFPDMGTVLFSRIAVASANLPRAAAFDWGVLSLPVSGETVCGDAWAIDAGTEDMPIRFLVADGLGHGAGAGEASSAAVAVFRETYGPNQKPAQALERMHGALRATRGAAAALASLDEAALTFAGVGNIQAALVTQEETKGLVSFNGTIGHQASKFADMVYPVNGAPLLVMASDGLTTQWRLDRYPGWFNRHPAVIAGLLFRDFSRGRDDATVLAVALPEKRDKTP